MFLNSDYILPADLTGYVREGLADRPINAFTLNRWLPDRTVDDLQYRFTQGGEALVDAAVVRAYDAESPIGARPGFTRVTGELPPISRKIRLGEYDRLRLRQDPNVLIQHGIMDDAMRMARSIAARVEMFRGEALYTGKLTISENGVIATVDFGRAAGHTVTAGTPWTTTASATPLSDIQSWMTTYLAANGVNPGAIITSTRVMNLLLQNTSLRGLLAANGVTPSLVNQLQMQGLFSAFGIPPIYVYDTQVSVGGSATRVIPDDKVVFVPPPVDGGDWQATDMGATFWGTTAESLEPNYGIEPGQEPGIVAGAYHTFDPVAVWTKAAAISLPVLASPNLTFCADVA